MGRLMQCRVCGQEVARVKDSENYATIRYVDLKGSLWEGRRCPPCSRADTRKRNYAVGRNKPRDLSDYPKLVKGNHAERVALAWLRENGYPNATRGAGKGPDIIAGDLTFEVKSVTFDRGVPRISMPYEARRADTFLIIVFPNGRVHMESMQEFLQKGCKGNMRTIRGLYELYTR